MANTWLMATEAADHAKVSTWTIREAVKQGELPAYAVGRSGRQYRLRVQDVDDWMMSRAWEPEWARPQNL
ncbi:excisionase family DNA-binding protein [Mycolicibacterium neoaurum]|uniref:excisionase family DNA-binding protein n=1 Tax=Mycolicibacterium neoaurum TaxID=1795 RepID=UPI0034D3B4A3